MVPLYFLHIRDGSRFEADPDGIDLPDLDAASAEARRVARELLAEVPGIGGEAVIEIADPSGQALVTIQVHDGSCI